MLDYNSIILDYVFIVVLQNPENAMNIIYKFLFINL